MADNVNHPSHYETGNFECIDVMLETQGLDAVKAFCICNAFKYIYRHNGKNGDEDIRKAKWYIDKYVELVDKQGEYLCNSCIHNENIDSTACDWCNDLNNKYEPKDKLKNEPTHVCTTCKHNEYIDSAESRRACWSCDDTNANWEGKDEKEDIVSCKSCKYVEAPSDSVICVNCENYCNWEIRDEG